MKIAMVGPPLPVPPAGYGPVETVIHDLTEGLVLRGHQVILFGSAQSRTSARLIPHADGDPDPAWPVATRELIFERSGRLALQRAADEGVEIIHDHIYASAPEIRVPILHTVHGFPAGELVEHLSRVCRSGKHRLIAISQRQKLLLLEKRADLPCADVVHHGLDFSGTTVGKKRDDFFLFLGRASPEKGGDGAIRVANLAGVKLVMALRSQLAAERLFLESEIAPLARGSGGRVTLLPEASAQEKYELMARAQGVLFTSRWEEPFGLVMIEAMACGTPVFAFRRGSAPELIVDGATGFLSDTEKEMAATLRRVGEINPVACRAHVDRLFSSSRMVGDYERLYEGQLRS